MSRAGRVWAAAVMVGLLTATPVALAQQDGGTSPNQENRSEGAEQSPDDPQANGGSDPEQAGPKGSDAQKGGQAAPEDEQPQGESSSGEGGEVSAEQAATPPEQDSPEAAEGEQPSQQARDRAREAYARGQRLLEEGRFAEAEQAFEQAYDAVANPVVLVAVSKARENQGKLVGAIRALVKYLKERPDAPDKKQVTERLKKLRDKLGTLVISSTPSGAKITVDGEQAGQTTPAEIRVTPGEHTVGVSLAEHETASRTVQAEMGGRQELEFELQSKEPEAKPMGEGAGVAEPKEPSSSGGPPKEQGPSTGVWVATGVAAASLVAGTVLGFMALSEESDFNDMPTEETADDGERFALFADVAFGVAAASAITGVVLHFTEGDREEEKSTAVGLDGGARVDVVPAIGPKGGGVSARVQF